MNNKLICPFCGQKLRNCCAGVIYTCSKPDACPHEQCYGSKELWQELIRTRKALEIAVDALKRIKEPTAWGTLYQEQEIANKALEQITALEQKDVK